jgi:hypothetical protein
MADVLSVLRRLGSGKNRVGRLDDRCPGCVAPTPECGEPGLVQASPTRRRFFPSAALVKYSCWRACSIAVLDKPPARKRLSWRGH